MAETLILGQRPAAIPQRSGQRDAFRENPPTGVPWGQEGWPGTGVGIPEAPGHVGFYVYTAAPDAEGEADHRGVLEQIRCHATDSNSDDNSAALDTVGIGDQVFMYGPSGKYGITAEAVGLTTGVYTFDSTAADVLTGTITAGDVVSIGVVLAP